MAADADAVKADEVGPAREPTDAFHAALEAQFDAVPRRGANAPGFARGSRAERAAFSLSRYLDAVERAKRFRSRAACFASLAC